MKKMTKIGILMFLSVFTFTACENDMTSPLTLEDESALVDFMFLATANDSTNKTQRKPDWRGGKKCKVTEVAIADLPAAVTAYIASNFTGSTVNRAGKLENGNFVVKITKADATHAGLVFDAAGAFVAEKTGKKGLRGTEVAVADLPAAITSYISANYAGATIKKAIKNEEGRFLVIIQKADESYAGVGFNADGSFISEMTRKDKKKKG